MTHSIDRPLPEPSGGAPRIVIAANRGPNDFVWQRQRWTTRKSAGGLVSMITPLAKRGDVSWFCCVSEPPDATQGRSGLFTTAKDQSDARLHVVPVPLPAAIYHSYYGEISNEVLWMLQHRVVGGEGFGYLDAARHRAWDSYLAANQHFAGAIAAAGSPPAAFLVQDYHFYPLPAMLRVEFPDTPILHFTHIPFPNASTLLLLPNAWRRSILSGLLGADVVGLQTQDDVRAFLDACEHLLGSGVNHAHRTVRAADGRIVRVRAYPASVEPRTLRRTASSLGVRSARERLRNDLGAQTIVRVDRLDPSKNQAVGFRAFGRLLEARPDLRNQVRFLAFLVPSRTDLGIYLRYRDAVYEVIREVNERFGPEIGRDPIQVYYTNDQEQALAAMIDCDVLLVNSLADGMNLVAKEWAVLSERPGVLVVSETAGVAQEAGSDALKVSPLDVEGTTEALVAALEMPHPARERRLQSFRRRVVQWTASDWLSAQLQDLGISLPPSAV